MNNLYSFRIYDTELMALVHNHHELSLGYAPHNLHFLGQPLPDIPPGEGIIKRLEYRLIPRDRAFADVILKTLGLSHNDTKGIIDACKGLPLNMHTLLLSAA